MRDVGLINGGSSLISQDGRLTRHENELGLLRETVGEMGWISSYKKGNSRKRGVREEENNDWVDTWNV